MDNQQHPITPPPELVEQWRYAASNVPASFCTDPGGRRDYIDYIATQAARWGADQELEACCEYIAGPGEWFVTPKFRLDELRAARRPKPPSLAKQGCDALDTYIYGNPNHKDKERTYNTIRAALERLKELEKGNE